ncbi:MULTISPECIES: DUF2242 domain-containing protein [unclassified Paraburkholderia]|uniref:DUF2242 domain-containing protein n=1 Tax=unclassified Paraburkholderia TaxID=2615204 RepID=UPI001609F6B7|nr:MULTISPECIES: DUF2242 domain-containing protein [unclassified Paraburkholderia]MBB5445974.1 hypothetical protein [Paraburkholderia sp. WSM4177]MBB5486594.1 hypothetical protein [Paraburkholderia sp. WSM4180]
MQNPFSRTTAAALFGLVALTACSSTPQPKFTQELFETGASPYARNFNSSTGDSCEAARRALLSQGYLTTMSRPDTVDGTKNFQPTGDSHVVVEFHVVCTPGEEAADTSIVYVNAVQNGFALKKSDTSASVGLSVLGSLSLPIRSNSDAMVKISSETIPSGKFYDRFFRLVDHYLQTVVRTQPVTSSPIETRTLPMPVAAPLQLTIPEPVPEPVAATTSAAVQATPTVPVQRTSPALAQSTTDKPVAVTPPAAAQPVQSAPAPVQLTTPAPAPLTTPSTSSRVQPADPIGQAAAIEPTSGTAPLVP